MGAKRAATVAAAAVCAVLALSVGAPAVAVVDANAKVRMVRAVRPPTIDPQVADAEWAQGNLPEATFENITTRRQSAMPTRVSMLYDDKNLYVAFVCSQPGLPIVATQSTNDVGFGTDDFVGVGIDTSGNGSQVYFFESSPRGIRYQQASESVRYKPQWSAAGYVGNDYWTAFLTIPLNAMRIHGGTQNWRINFIRGVAATGDHLTWAYAGVMQDGPIPFWPSYVDARYWPAVASLDVASSSRDVRPRPHVEIYGLNSIGADRGLFQQANGAFTSESIRNAGVDATLPLTNTVNFVTTFDPDFSNVEVDQVTIAPQEFRRNLQEYRTFFAQGSNFINANGAPVGVPIGQPALVFYSPGVGPFSRGDKIEGTFGKQSFGLLNFRGFDQISGNSFNDIAYGFKHAESNRSFVYWLDGVSAHHSNAGSDVTNELGVASRNLGSGFVWLLNSSVEQGSSIPLTGIAHSSYGFVDEQKPNYEVNLGYQNSTPNYNPIDGITPNSDLRGFNGYFVLNGNTSAIKNWAVQAIGDRLADLSGAVHQADAIFSGAITFKDQISLYNLGTQIGELRSYAIPGGPGCNGPVVGASYFTGYPCYLDGQVTNFTLYGGAVGYRDGTPAPVDMSIAEGPYGANHVQLYTWSTSRPLGQRFSISLEYDGTRQRSITTNEPDSQWLRRVSLGTSISENTNFSISLRSVNGQGGFALPGTNLAASYHRIFSGAGELYVNFGTPAAPATLNRFIIKYVVHVGGGTGT